MWSRDGRSIVYWARAPNSRGYFMKATIEREPELSVSRRDSLFPFVATALLAHANFDVMSNGDLVMVQRIPEGRTRLFAHVNWFGELKARVEAERAAR